MRQPIGSLRAGKLEVGRYERGLLHTKAYILSVDGDTPPIDDQHGIIAGSSNLTGAGLAENPELNLSHSKGSLVKTACDWYDEVWEDAEPYDLAQVFEAVLHHRTPWKIFIRLERVKPPNPLPPIDAVEIEVVCWMGIECAG